MRHSLKRSPPVRLLRGIRATLLGLKQSANNREVRRAYLWALLFLAAVTWTLSGLGLWLTFRYVPVIDLSAWRTILNWILRLVFGALALMVAPVLALPLTQLLAPAFSGAPFFAGLRALHAARSAALLNSPGLGARAGVLMTVRKLPSFFAVGFLLFLVGWVPALGPPIAAVGHLLNTSRMVSWELLDPYLDARLLDYQSRNKLITERRYEVLGFGLVCAPLLGIPIVGPFFFGWLQAATAQFVHEVFESEEDSYSEPSPPLREVF